LKAETVQLEDGSTAQLSYTYWRNGVRKTLTDAAGRVTFYEYDGRNRLKRLTTNQGGTDEQVTAYEYWPDSLLKTVTKPDGTVTSYDYDRSDRLKSVVVHKDGSEILSYAYTYDSNGNRRTQVETNGGAPETTTYGYDALDRLESVRYPDGRTVTYGYDAVGNRRFETELDAASVVLSQKTAVFDAANRLSTVTDAVNPSNNATFNFDSNGNLTAKTTATGTETYAFDHRDQLVETAEGERITARFAYDAFGRRYLKIGDEGLRQYLFDETSLLQEYSQLDVEVAKYDWGGDRLVSLFRVDEPRRYFHLDALGSVVALTDDQGVVGARYHYDAWGDYREPDELETSANPFGFTGHIYDRETDLYFAKARYFDPEFGRFLTQDSYLGLVNDPPSLHRYLYAYGNPARYVDPDGHDPVTFAQAVAHGRGWDYAKSQLNQGAAEAGRASKQWLGNAGMGISTAAAWTLSMTIDHETGDIGMFSPGHNPTREYLAKMPQPQNETEHHAALIADVGFVAAPLVVKALPGKGGTVIRPGAARPASVTAADEAAAAESGTSLGQKTAVVTESAHGKGAAPRLADDVVASAKPVGEPAVPADGASSSTGGNDALYARSSFRKSTLEHAKGEAARNQAGEMTCPTCEKVMPEKITVETKKGPVDRRGFDMDHFNKTWAQRVKEMRDNAAATGREPSRKEVLDEYNRLLRAQCPKCNQSHQFEGQPAVTPPTATPPRPQPPTAEPEPTKQ
jgi:RHS repeat-associated protein